MKLFLIMQRDFSTTIIKPSKILSCTEIYVLNIRLKISKINIVFNIIRTIFK